MTNYLVNLIVILLIILIVVVVSFAVLDRLMKGGFKKPAEKTSTPAKAAQDKPAEKPVEEPKAPTAMKIYNSELADDLNAMLKDADTATPARLQIENHMNKESNIAKYLQSKNYHGFDFGMDDNFSMDDEANEPMTFTREDYKRFVALSNIDDKKPL